MKLLQSASKIVFLMVAITACLWFFFNKITNEQFVGIVSLVFLYYFQRKDPTTPTPTSI